MPSGASEAITSVRLSVSVDGPLGTPSFPIGQVDVGVASEEGGLAREQATIGKRQQKREGVEEAVGGYHERLFVLSIKS